ncbi:DUF6882 domain-containing protein [Aquimarina sp. 2201CG5-10]|uniref:DUF6882 domain-containing protein n=1 Tax=Aquimarina callyspongiae TaxID=3098150 RepID=UPI002AB4C7B0|nr:DUF6882 domain-containing protein [Aquimarina sp. 2201CG5-10]MDY8134508.1 hypothetical protein [Aquimarina sp. 2201CG5-10]
MSVFKKIFGKSNQEKNSEITTNEFATLSKTEWNTFEELLAHSAGLSFEKQLLFGDVIGSNSWQFDMNSGTISFGSELSFPVQVIGSLSFNDSSWMWGWANAQSNIPDSLLVQSKKIKELGERKGIDTLSEGHISVEEGFEHQIGMIACALFNANSYYCANYGQGTLVVTIESDQIPSINLNSVEKILTHFPQLIGGVEVDHKEAFKNYLIDRDFQLKIDTNKIEGVRNGKLVTGEFDEIGRLKNLNGKI